MNAAMSHFEEQLDSYTRGSISESLEANVKLRTQLLKELLLKGSLEMSEKDHDLIHFGVVHLESIWKQGDSVGYTIREPLAHMALFRYLAKNNIKYEDILVE